MRRLSKIIYRIPLIVGCLFLAWVMVLLTKDTAVPYLVQEFDLTEAEVAFSWETDGGFNGADGDGVPALMNGFIDAYNICGYYDYELFYLETGNVTAQDIRAGYVVLFLIFTLILTVPVMIGGIRSKKKISFYEVFHCYFISGLFLGMILLVGKTPSYRSVMLLVVGWVYMNLAKSCLEIKEQRSLQGFLKRFPKSLFFCYIGILCILLAMPVFMPDETLPEANMETKNAIFAKLQEINLVTSQYEENLKKNIENQQKKEEENKEEQNKEENKEQLNKQDSVVRDDSENNILKNQNNYEEDDENPRDENEDDENENTVNNDNGNESNITDVDENGLDESGANDNGLGFGGSETEGIGLGFGGSETDGIGLGIGGSGIGGGGISGGRTDRTGNLQLQGKTILTVYSDFNPGRNIYIRLFYAEEYEDKRWKKVDDGEDIPVFYSLQTSWSAGNTKTAESTEDAAAAKSTEDTEAVEGILQLEYGTANSETTLNKTDPNRILVSSSRAFDEYYGEVEDYFSGDCKVVPTDLQKVLENEFPQMFGLGADAFSREEAIQEIEQLLEERAYYTLSPGKVPAGEDFITWFLTEKKCGYCMHFASAGVMMLRQAGISSRYAEGYVVPASAWKQGENGIWYAEVMDKNAHAWAEVYIDSAGSSAEEDWDDTDSGNGYSGDGNFGDGYWKPVEMTPAYDGELAGSFAGQSDQYVGRLVIPAVIIKIVKWILKAVFTVILAALGVFLYQKGLSWYEYRMLHTGSRNRDVRNMMRLLLNKSARSNKEVKRVLEKGNLTREEFTETISDLITESEEDETAAANMKKWFAQLSNYGYQASFGKVISRQQRMEALCLYGKLKHELFQKKKRNWLQLFRRKKETDFSYSEEKKETGCSYSEEKKETDCSYLETERLD